MLFFVVFDIVCTSFFSHCWLDWRLFGELTQLRYIYRVKRRCIISILTQFLKNYHNNAQTVGYKNFICLNTWLSLMNHDRLMFSDNENNKEGCRSFRPKTMFLRVHRPESNQPAMTYVRPIVPTLKFESIRIRLNECPTSY